MKQLSSTRPGDTVKLRAFKTAISIGTTALALGCSGKVVDLDNSSAASAAGATNSADVVLLSRRDDPVIGNITLDDERIYWISSSQRVQSCLKDNCAHTVTTYAHSAEPSGDGLTYTPSASLGRVFWLGDDPSPTIYTCPRAGCQGAPLALIRDPYALSLVTDDGYVYWSSAFDLYRCAAAGCGPTPEVVARGEGNRPVFSGTNAFWIGVSNSADDTRPIRRAPKDGSGVATTLFTPENPGNLRILGDDLYWIGEGLFTCPTTGCTGNPIRIASAQVLGTPYDETLAVDASGLYWLDDGVQYCPLTGCSQATALTPLAQSFAVDADYVYWTDTTDLSGLNIHRLPKPKAL